MNLARRAKHDETFGGSQRTPSGDQAGIRIVPAGDEAVLVDFGNVINREVNRRVRAFAAILTGTSAPAPWVRDVVPAYSSLLLRYDPDRIDYDGLVAALSQLAERGDDNEILQPRRLEIPVRYGGVDGPDLPFVAQYTGLTPDEVVALHSAPVYVVYMLGFTPGFCYLGDLPAALTVERRATPRISLPAGAVAIGGAQTGIYSLHNSPGGWRWIGRTELPLWVPDKDPPFLIGAGDEVRFVPV